jgi:hypothetical protein
MDAVVPVGVPASFVSGAWFSACGFCSIGKIKNEVSLFRAFKQSSRPCGFSSVSTRVLWSFSTRLESQFPVCNLYIFQKLSSSFNFCFYFLNGNHGWKLRGLCCGVRSLGETAQGRFQVLEDQVKYKLLEVALYSYVEHDSFSQIVPPMWSSVSALRGWAITLPVECEITRM